MRSLYKSKIRNSQKNFQPFDLFKKIKKKNSTFFSRKSSKSELLAFRNLKFKTFESKDELKI